MWLLNSSSTLRVSSKPLYEKNNGQNEIFQYFNTKEWKIFVTLRFCKTLSACTNSWWFSQLIGNWKVPIKNIQYIFKTGKSMPHICTSRPIMIMQDSLLDIDATQIQNQDSQIPNYFVHPKCTNPKLFVHPKLLMASQIIWHSKLLWHPKFGIPINFRNFPNNLPNYIQGGEYV